jgi:predicted hotdog family 3-hydroxylacyl-ACP dehydratase
MVLIDRVLEVGEGYLEAETRVRADDLFDDRECVPASVGFEYMAQGIAAYAGSKSLLAGEPVRLGFLIGTRLYRSNVGEFPVGSRLTVRVREILQDDSGLGVFDCELAGDTIRVSARVNVFQPGNVEEYLSRQEP